MTHASQRARRDGGNCRGCFKNALSVGGIATRMCCGKIYIGAHEKFPIPVIAMCCGSVYVFSQEKKHSYNVTGTCIHTLHSVLNIEQHLVVAIQSTNANSYWLQL